MRSILELIYGEANITYWPGSCGVFFDGVAWWKRVYIAGVIPTAYARRIV